MHIVHYILQMLYLFKTILFLHSFEKAQWITKVCMLLCWITRRLTPKNVHQRPTVALLCGPHVQGAQGISCGRHLANHEVEVILFLPNFVKMLDSVTSELTLFSKTEGKQVSSIKGILMSNLL